MVSGLCSINPLARSPSLAMSSPPAPSPHHSPLSGPSSSPPAMVVDPAEYQRVLEENERMRNAGTLLEQQLAVAESEKLKLSTALASSSTPVPAVVAPPRISQAIAPSAHVKGPPLTSFTGSMGFEVDHWLRSVRKQFNFFGSAVFPDDLKRIAYAALYLEGAALDWWESEDRADVTTWEAFVALLHKRWQPRLAAEVARQKIALLKQRGTVSQLCNVLQQLMTQVPTMHEDDKIFAFKQALDKPLAAKVAEQAPKSLQEAMYAAVQAELYVGRSSSSSNTNSFFGLRQGGGNRFTPASSSTAPMEVSALDQIDESSFVDDTATGSAPPKGQPVPTYEQLLAMFHRNSGGSARSGNKQKAKIPGVSKADFDRCMKENRCLKCKEVGHLARDCTNPPRLNW